MYKTSRASKGSRCFLADADDRAFADKVGILDAGVERQDLVHGNLCTKRNLGESISVCNAIVDYVALLPEVAISTAAGHIFHFLLIEDFHFIVCHFCDLLF